jgi:hypothetical protein
MTERAMSEFLTEEEVCARYRGLISPGTLRNWRSLGIGPNYTKIGRAVLYSTVELDKFDRANTVTCDLEKGCTKSDAA